jgi:integration host factor subunit alpha
MTKADIARAIHGKVGGLTVREAAQLVDATFEILKETLGSGEKVKISGFGNFAPRDKRQRRGRNPQTGERIEIEERRVLTFKPSVILKELLNRKAGKATDVRDGAEDRRRERA